MKPEETILSDNHILGKLNELGLTNTVVLCMQQQTASLQSQIDYLTEERDNLILEKIGDNDVYQKLKYKLTSLELAHKQEREGYEKLIEEMNNESMSLLPENCQVEDTEGGRFCFQSGKCKQCFEPQLLSPQAKEFNFKCYGEMGGHGRCDELCKNCLTKYPENKPKAIDDGLNVVLDNRHEINRNIIQDENKERTSNK